MEKWIGDQLYSWMWMRWNGRKANSMKEVRNHQSKGSMGMEWFSSKIKVCWVTPRILTQIESKFFLFRIWFDKSEKLGRRNFICERRFLPWENEEEAKRNDALDGRPLHLQVTIGASIYDGRGTCPSLDDRFTGDIRCKCRNPIDPNKFRKRPNIKFKLKLEWIIYDIGPFFCVCHDIFEQIFLYIIYLKPRRIV